MAMVVIVFQANSILRQAFYEVFLHVHIALVILCIVALRKHLHGLPEQKYLTVVIAIWAFEVSLSIICNLSL